jgi:hypothetical protein
MYKGIFRGTYQGMYREAHRGRSFAPVPLQPGDSVA